MWKVEMKNVHKHYFLGGDKVSALRNVNLTIPAQRFSVLSGMSGSGKTTLLNIIGGIDNIDNGTLFIGGQDMGAMNDNQRSVFRARNLGYIFQNFNLIPVLSAEENIEFPLIIQGYPARYRRKMVRDMLDNVGLQGKEKALPGQLSGGATTAGGDRPCINSPSSTGTGRRTDGQSGYQDQPRDPAVTAPVAESVFCDGDFLLARSSGDFRSRQGVCRTRR